MTDDIFAARRTLAAAMTREDPMHYYTNPDDQGAPDPTDEDGVAAEVDIRERVLFHLPSLRRQLLTAIPEARMPTPTEARQYRRTGTDAA